MKHESPLPNPTQDQQNKMFPMLSRVFVASLTPGLALIPGAPSMAQSSSTVYGVVDLGFVLESGGPNDAGASRLTSGVASGSRLGFRGDEDLGGGLSALYALEMGLLADTGGLAQGGQAAVSIHGNFGSITLGRQYTPVALIQTETAPFVTCLAGDSANLISAGGAGGNNRMDNTLRYTYKASSGLAADVVYGFGEGAGDSSAERQYGGALGYVAGPAYAKLGYHSVNDAVGKAGRLTFLGATYDFGFAMAHFNYVVNKGSAVFDIVNQDSRDMLLGIPAEAVRACLPISGIMDLHPPAPETGCLEQRVYTMVLRGPGDDAAMSPIHWSAGNTVPMHLSYGEHDSERVQRSNQELAQRLSQAGAPCSLSVEAGQNHFSTHTALRAPQASWDQRLEHVLKESTP
ncbi:porin [Comamonas sp. AG1104]|uniref:porin n=1 Tax=Comamonas sp. AG1104 TaxID=2183900 RepID=UPI000E0BB148|nr:porin [Comamonas sp. AG1104]RDI05517.1 porin-like protein [Comamonas sp. AG1104]